MARVLTRLAALLLTVQAGDEGNAAGLLDGLRPVLTGDAPEQD